MSSPSEKVHLLACLPLLVLLVFPSISACSMTPASITLATTTSTYDSGLLGELIPPFEKEQGVTANVVAVGTGQALALGERGDAHVLLVHDPQAEVDFMSKGLGEVRRRVMYNDFIIVGPPQDPAGIRGLKDAAQALSGIARAGVPFVSRGDSSGTYSKEKALWKKAGITPEGAWCLSAGQGMGETLNLAREKSAYTLSDRATFLAQGKPGLEVLVEGDPDLQNIYHVIMVKGLSGKEAELARKLMDYFTSAQTQERIASFSGGERQRVALARALAVGPDVLLFDEPIANLDPYNVTVIEQLIARVNREGATVVMVTHNVFQARRLCHRAALMLDGKLVEIGEKEEIFTRPGDPRTAGFVRGEMVY